MSSPLEKNGQHATEGLEREKKASASQGIVGCEMALNGDRGILIFPVQLTTSRVGSLTRLTLLLLYVMTIHTYCEVKRATYLIMTYTTVLIRKRKGGSKGKGNGNGVYTLFWGTAFEIVKTYQVPTSAKH